MIKILIVGMSDNIGGIEIYLINLFRNIDKKKFDVRFLIFKGDKPCFFEEIQNNIIYITKRSNNYRKFKDDLKNLYQKEAFDIIHCNLMSFSFFEPIIYAIKYSNSKIVIHSHTAGRTYMPLLTKIINKIGLKRVLNYERLGRYTKCACSNNAGIYLFSRFNNDSFRVLNNGFNILPFLFNENSRKKYRKVLNIKEDEILLGNVGRLTEPKNQIFLVEIMNLLINKYHSFNYKLLIIGKGELRKKLDIAIGKYNLGDYIIFKENIDNIGDYLSAMDVFLLPSIFEGLCISLIEAQANGLYSIASDTVPIETKMTNLVTYLNLNNIENWVNCIKKYNYKERIIDLSLLKEKFDINNTVKKIESFYEDTIINSKGVIQ